jgi:hypothetical protein
MVVVSKVVSPSAAYSAGVKKVGVVKLKEAISLCGDA